MKSFISINSIGKADESICFLPYLYDINPNGYFINVVCTIMIRERNNDYSVDFFKKMINDVDYLEEKMVKKLYLSFTYVICEKLVVWLKLLLFYFFHSQNMLLRLLLIQLY